MAGATLTTLSNILKDYYLGPIQEQFNNDILVLQLTDVDAENLEGNRAVVPLHSARSGGVGSRAEGGTLPTAGNQAYQKAVFDLKYHYGRIQVTGPSIAKTKSDAGSFARVLQEELTKIKNDLMLNFARQVYGDGTAAIDTIPTGTTSATQTVSSKESLYKGFLYVGLVCDVGTSASPTASTSAKTITDVDVNNTQVTFNASFTSVNSDKIFVSGSATGTGTNIYEMVGGLQAFISTAANTYGTLDSTAAGNKFWQAQFDTSGGGITLAKLMTNWNKVINSGGRADQEAVITSMGLARNLFASNDFNAGGGSNSNVRYVNQETLNGGFDAITFASGSGRLTLMADRLHPWGKVHFLHKKHFRMFSPADWDFLSRDGLTIRWVADQDAFQAVLYRYAEMGGDRRNTSLVMSGLTDTGF